ncbi:MAG: M20/M25/M40 family metallo-hydrolase [Promethearchaeota archaeon]
MNEEEKDFLMKCIKIYSPSGNEEKLSKFLADFLKNHDFKIQFDNVGNLIAEQGEKKPVLLLVSHMDTIPGELPVFEKDGKIYGRGAVDCKPSLAAMIYSICKYDFKQENVGKIIFGGIIREEDSLIGIEEFLKSKIEPDFAIFGEPTNINQICIGYKGRLCIGFKILANTGHVASSWQYVNTIEVGFEIWNVIKGVCRQLNEKYCQKHKKTRYFNKIIPNLSTISGGNLTNCVPSECEIHIDIRFPPNVSLEIIIEEIKKHVLDFKDIYENKNKKKFQIQEKILSSIEGFEVKGDDLIVGALRWAIYKTISKKPKLIKKTGTTFINKIGIELKIPSITYGPGNSKLEHTDEEFIDLEEFSKSIEIYTKFYTKFFENYRRTY